MRTLNDRLFGWILLFVWLLSSIQLVIAQVPHVLVAFCYLGILVAALGFIFDRPSLVYAYVSVALIAQVPFSIDLIRAYLGLDQLLGLVTYDPSYHSLASRIVDLGVHILVLPFVLFGVRTVSVPTYRSFVKWYLIMLSFFVIISIPLDANCVTIGCFETLAYGTTLVGHIAYFSIVAIIGPLLIAYSLRRAHKALTFRRT